MNDLPPVHNLQKLLTELSKIERSLRAEALQVAWLAHLENRNAATAINTWRRRERRHVKRMKTNFT
ncbi:MAG: hypothetical protein K8R92_00840 [Planctomycetes bacterium]|nr:hypothetical protein [Planctomycetota bacterium]